ncbi:Murein hydrolase activator NlpD [bacterium HR19]|nr:Murein hydrolase activator NlpD [bacterium HR19]
MQICETKREIRLWLIVLPFFLYFIGCGYGIYHHVKRGETLSDIARKYGVSEKDISEANKKFPWGFDPEGLKEGDVIYIPLDRKEAKSESVKWKKQETADKTETSKKTTQYPENKDKKNAGDESDIKDESYERSLTLSALHKTKQDDNLISDEKDASRKEKANSSDKKIPPKIESKGSVKLNLASADRTRSGRLSFIPPVKGKVISNFGDRNGREHKGVDISAPEGTDILAAEDGVVIFSGFLKGYGNVVIIKHEGDYFTVYAHNKYNTVKENEFVKRGQVIGKVGQTGNATTPHLHFEVRRGTKPLNPLDFLSID